MGKSFSIPTSGGEIILNPHIRWINQFQSPYHQPYSPHQMKKSIKIPTSEREINLSPHIRWENHSQSPHHHIKHCALSHIRYDIVHPQLIFLYMFLPRLTASKSPCNQVAMVATFWKVSPEGDLDDKIVKINLTIISRESRCVARMQLFPYSKKLFAS